MTIRAILLTAFATLAFTALQCRADSAPYVGVAPTGDAQAGAHFATTTCAACHGAHGNSVSPTFPNLAGQNYNYLLKQLEDFRDGKRKKSPMNAMIRTVPTASGQQNLKNIAAYYAAQTLNRKANANAHAPQPSARAAQAGYAIYQHGLSASHVPACAACHAASGKGMAPMAIPALAGQHSVYLASELKLFANGERHNSPGHVMSVIARRLTAQQIKEVALYAQALHPDLIPGQGPKTYQAYVQALAHQVVPGIPSGPSGKAAPAKH